MTILRKYNEEAIINFSLFTPDGIDFVSDATFAAGDIVIMSDEGAEANSTNLPVDEGTGYSLTLTAAELSAARLKIYIVDQTDPKFWLDTSINLETYGNASAQHAFDLDSATVSADMVSISGDTQAADNLEAMYDGSGYDNAAAPATQAQLSGIGAGSGGGLNYPVTEDNTSGALLGVTFLGTQTGTFSNTRNDLTTFHTIDADGNGDIDIVYCADIGSVNTASTLTLQYYSNPNAGTGIFQVYDFNATQWVTVGNIDTRNNTTIREIVINLYNENTGELGTSEAGRVYIRCIADNQGSMDLNMAQITVNARSSTSTMGYEEGKVWIDTSGSGTSTGIIQGVDGVFANQSDSIANGLTIANNLGTSRLNFHPNGVYTIPSAFQGYVVTSIQATVIGNGQLFDDSRFMGGFMTGVFARDGSGSPTFDQCILQNVTADGIGCFNGGFRGTFTMTEQSLYTFGGCVSADVGSLATFDFNSLGGAELNMADYAGNINVVNMAAGDILRIHGNAGGTITIGGADGTVYISGTVGAVTDNRTGSPSLTNESVPLTGGSGGDITAINGSALAASNLALQYDGTGVVGDNFPSTQRQVGSIATGSSVISKAADSSTTTTGNETGTVANTLALDSTYHTFTPVGGDTDFYYEFDVGSGAVGTQLVWDGYVQGGNDSCNVYAYDWITDGWILVGVIDGENNSNNDQYSFIITSAMTGFDANEGVVRIRFESSDATTIATDRLIVGYTVIVQQGAILTSGTAQAGATNTITLAASASASDEFYTSTAILISGGTGAQQERMITAYNGTSKVATVTPAWIINPDNTSIYNVIPATSHSATSEGNYDSASVHIDFTDGEAGTLKNVNGITTNPVNNFPDARTLADLLSIRKFMFSGFGLATLDQDYTGWRFVVEGSIQIDLDGNDISGSTFVLCGVTGVGTSSQTNVFERCGIIDATLDSAIFNNCSFGGSLDLTAGGLYLIRGGTLLSSEATTTFDFNGNGILLTRARVFDWQGAVTIENMTATDELHVSGNSVITLGASCTGGTLNFLGDVRVIDNSGNVTINEGVIAETKNDTEALINAVALLPDIDAIWDEALAGHNGAGTAGAALTGAGSAGDPWSTVIPAAYGAGTAGQILGDGLDSVLSQVEAKIDAIQGAGFVTGTDSLEAIRDRGDNAWTTGAGGSSPTVEEIRSEIDSNSTQLAAILADTNELQTNQGDWATATGFATNEPDNAGIAAIGAAIGQLNDLSVNDVLNTQLTESYAADGVAPTLAQALMLIQQNLGDFSINGTTVTVRRLDGSTTAATYTLDDNTTPTSRTRS